MLATAALLVVSLGIMVFVHEAAHLVSARLLGVRVEELGLGQGPILLRREFAGTIVSLRPLPLGGFARMGGTHDAAEPGAYASCSRRGRAAILLSGPAANLLAAFLVLLATDLGTAPRALADLAGDLGGFASGLLTGGGLFGAMPDLLGSAAGGEVHTADGYASILALVGLYFGLFNLLPLLPLDGGRLLLLASEAIVGREASPRTIGALTACGVAAMTVLALFLAAEDLRLLLSHVFSAIGV